MSLYLPIADLTISIWLILGIGAAVGVVSGLFGIGGGFLMTPLLLVLGIPPAVAVGTGSMPILATSLSGAIAQNRRGNVDVTLSLVLTVGGLVGAFIGVEAMRALRQLGQFDVTVALAYVVLLGLVALLMLFENLTILHQSRRSPPPRLRRRSEHVWLHGLPWKMRFRKSKLYVSALPPLVIGSFVGFLIAVMGFGGSLIVVPALIYLMRVPANIAVGTSLLQATLVSAATIVLTSSVNHSVDASLGAILVAGVVIGTPLGVTASSGLKVWQLRIVLAALVFLVALRVGYDLFIEPPDRFTVQTLNRGLQ